MQLPHEAVAARSNRPVDEASAAMVNRALPDATFQASPPNGLAFSCRERTGNAFKNPMISRAKRSAAMPGWAVAQGIAFSRDIQLSWFGT